MKNRWERYNERRSESRREFMTGTPNSPSVSVVYVTKLKRQMQVCLVMAVFHCLWFLKSHEQLSTSAVRQPAQSFGLSFSASCPLGKGGGRRGGGGACYLLMHLSLAGQTASSGCISDLLFPNPEHFSRQMALSCSRRTILKSKGVQQANTLTSSGVSFSVRPSRISHPNQRKY